MWQTYQKGKHPYHSYRYCLPFSTSDAHRGAKEGCSLLKLLLRGYLNAVSKSGVRDFIHALQQPDRSIELILAGAAGGQDRFLYLAQSLSKTPFQIRYGGDGMVLFTCLGWNSPWFTLSGTDCMFCASPFFYLNDSNGTARTALDDSIASTLLCGPINRCTSSDETFVTARRWLRDCISNGDDIGHKNCTSPGKNSPFVPNRLVQILPRDGEALIKLKDIQHDELLHYCCLSYCWGGDQPLQTNTHTIEARKAGLEFNELP